MNSRVEELVPALPAVFQCQLVQEKGGPIMEIDLVLLMRLIYK